uniref:T9SS type A sorting domain-containing protein n=1 Tax=candidate division WOR-3 bacterium TaxID=2052148 RepID=A0A7C4YGF0_UNCW3
MFSIVLTFLISTYPWPLRPFNSAHQVSATLGDARGAGTPDSARFHRGIDIPAIEGTKVYSIISDTAYWDGSSGINAYVRVGDYWYIHLKERKEDSTFVLGILDTTNTPPDTIGKVLDYPPSGPSGDHLHFQIGPVDGPFQNPLFYDSGPVGYDDNGFPVISSIDFWRQGSEGDTAKQLVGVLDGKIDIRMKCKDVQTSGGGNNASGIYKLSYSIANKYGNIVYNSGTTIVFPQVEPPNDGAPVLLVYDRHNYTSSSPFYYWMTNKIVNNEVINSYWNTKQKINQPDSIDAESIEVAKYPDGDYWVLGYAYDKKGNYNMYNERVTIANFNPEVRETHPVNNETKVSLNRSVYIRFSEPMYQNVNLYDAITISPGVSGDWRWIGDHEIMFTPDPGYRKNTTYTVSLSSKLKDLQMQSLSPYTFSFTTGVSDTDSTYQKYPTRFQWENITSWDVSVSWYNNYYTYQYLSSPFHFYNGYYDILIFTRRGSIWFEGNYDYPCFDLPTSGGTHSPVIAVYNDSLRHLNWSFGGSKETLDGFSGLREVVRWEYKYVQGSDTLETKFEAVLFSNGTIRFDYKKCEIWKFYHDCGSGVSKGDGNDYTSLTDKYGPVYLLEGRSFYFVRNEPPPGHPRNLQATYEVNEGGKENSIVHLKWRQNPENNLGGYIVYRRENNSIDYVPIDTIVVNAYDDSTVEIGNTYIYKVTAYNNNKLESTYSDSVIVSCGDILSNSPTATGYNNGRKIITTKDGKDVHIVYTSNNNIYYLTSQDSGNSFTQPECIFSGNYPVITMDTSGTPGLLWVKNNVLYYSIKMVSGWDPPDSMILYSDIPEKGEGVSITISQPSMVCDDNNMVHLVVPLHYGRPYSFDNLYYITFPFYNFNMREETTLVKWGKATSPSIVVDGSIPNIVWEGKGIFYAIKDTTGWEFDTISNSGYYPFIDIKEDGIMVVWHSLYQKKYHIFSRKKVDDWGEIKHISKGMYPVLANGKRCFFQDNLFVNYDIFMSEYNDVSGEWGAVGPVCETDKKSQYPNCFYNNGRVYLIWTEGNTYPYNIEFRRMNMSKLIEKEISSGVDKEFKIYPITNLVSSKVKIRYFSPDDREVSIKVYDITGRKIKEDRIISKEGMNEVVVEDKKMKRGVYFLYIETEGYKKIEKIIMLR